MVSLTSFGRVPVRAVLRRADGSVIARYGAREDDWNIAVSRLLPAGAYTLDLAAAVPPENGEPVAAPDRPAGASDDSESSSSDSDDAAPADPQNPQTAATSGARQETMPPTIPPATMTAARKSRTSWWNSA